MRNVLDWLDEAAKEAPQSAAFDQPDMGITWGELQKRAREIGSFIAGRLPAQSPVLILMEKSPMCIAAMLGAVYANCFYTPVDSSIPEARMQMIVSVLQQ